VLVFRRSCTPTEFVSPTGAKIRPRSIARPPVVSEDRDTEFAHVTYDPFETVELCVAPLPSEHDIIVVGVGNVRHRSEMQVACLKFLSETVELISCPARLLGQVCRTFTRLFRVEHNMINAQLFDELKFFSAKMADFKSDLHPRRIDISGTTL